jgi:hypothetical protein
MILSYRDKKTEGFAGGEFVKALQGVRGPGSEAAVDPERGAFSRQVARTTEQSL